MAQTVLANGGVQVLSDVTAQPLALEDEISSRLNDPSSSYWFRDALSSALKRDPMDAARDAAVLALILERRANALIEPLVPYPDVVCQKSVSGE